MHCTARAWEEEGAQHSLLCSQAKKNTSRTLNHECLFPLFSGGGALQ